MRECGIRRRQVSAFSRQAGKKNFRRRNCENILSTVLANTNLSSVKETLINSLCGMKRKAHGAQEPRHIQKYVEVTSTAQRSDSPAQRINQRFRNTYEMSGLKTAILNWSIRNGRKRTVYRQGRIPVVTGLQRQR